MKHKLVVKRWVEEDTPLEDLIWAIDGMAKTTIKEHIPTDYRVKITVEKITQKGNK